MSVYDEPTARRHRFARLAASPDPRRPGFVDRRVGEMACGTVVALIGLPQHRPAHLTDCAACYAGNSPVIP